jgi:dUTP pyrophosphatase
LKHFIDVGAGVVDFDYRGNIGVVLFNHSDADFQVSRGDRIAQLILEKIAMADIEEVDELFTTDRGDGGFGSTGVSEQESKRAKTGNLDTSTLPLIHTW